MPFVVSSVKPLKRWRSRLLEELTGEGLVVRMWTCSRLVSGETHTVSTHTQYQHTHVSLSRTSTPLHHHTPDSPQSEEVLLLTKAFHVIAVNDT